LKPIRLLRQNDSPERITATVRRRPLSSNIVEGTTPRRS
jgi:hypothetical protein